MELNPSTTAIEERIIEAAIECIEKFGIQGATNRRIAEMAGVNSAAINYYFRSKDVLIQRVMDLTLRNAFDWDDIEKLPGATAVERCKAVFNHLIAGGARYPGITRAHFYDLLVEGNYSSPAVEKLNDFLRRLAADLEKRGAGLPPAELRLACAQIASAGLMMILAPRIFAQGLDLDVTDETARQRFLDRLVDRLLAPGDPSPAGRD